MKLLFIFYVVCAGSAHLLSMDTSGQPDGRTVSTSISTRPTQQPACMQRAYEFNQNNLHYRSLSQSHNNATMHNEFWLDPQDSNRITLYVQQQFNAALQHFNTIIKNPQSIEAIHNSFNLGAINVSLFPQMNSLVQNTAYALQSYLFDAQGKYVGLNYDGIKAAQSIVQNFTVKGKELLSHIPFGKVVVSSMQPVYVLPSYITNNAFNQDLQKCVALCKQGDFHAAHKLVSHYKQLEKKADDRFFAEWREQWDDAVNLMATMYRTEFEKQYNAFGIKHVLANNPHVTLYLHETNSAHRHEVPNDSVNQKLMMEIADVGELLDYHKVYDEPSLKVVDITHNIVMRKGNGVAITEYLANNLHADSTNLEVRQAYTTFYSTHGLAKLVPSGMIRIDLQQYTIAPTIGNYAHLQDRITLYKLATFTVENNNQKVLIDRALSHLVQSCQEGDCWKSHSTLARNITEALYSRDSNMVTSISTLGNYTVLCQDALLYKKVLSFVADVTEQLYCDKTLSAQKIRQLNTSLNVIDTFWRGLHGSQDSTCATTLHQLLADNNDDTLRAIQEFKNKAQEHYQKQIESCSTVPQEDIIAAVTQLRYFPHAAQYRSAFNQQLQKNSALLYVQGVHTEKQYDISHESEQLLHNNSIDKKHFITFRGTPLQHMLHHEFLNIAHECAVVHARAEQSDANISLPIEALHLAEIGIGYNSSKQLGKAITLANTCWALLDCAVGVLEGTLQGVHNVAHCVIHPVDSVMGIGRSFYLAGQGLAKAAHMLSLSYKTLLDDQSARKELFEKSAKLTLLIDALKNKITQLTARDIAREVSSFATEAWLVGKLATRLHEFLVKARNFISRAHTTIQSAPKLAAVTTEGLRIEVPLAEQMSESFFNAIEKNKLLINACKDPTTKSEYFAILKNGYYEVNGVKFTPLLLSAPF